MKRFKVTTEHVYWPIKDDVDDRIIALCPDHSVAQELAKVLNAHDKVVTTGRKRRRLANPRSKP